MKILHCCLACFYIDDYGYQENLLPQQHKRDGHEVEILASTETFVDHKTLGYLQPGSYVSEFGIPVTRARYSRLLPHFIMKKIRMYVGITEVLDRFAPEIVFVHDCQFVDIRKIARYAKRTPNVRVFVDCHTDFINSGRNAFSKYIMQKVVYRQCARLIEPYAAKFFGTLPVRCAFLNEVYGIPREKIELLELGAEDDKIQIEQRAAMRERICGELGLATEDFIVVTGGKLDREKNTEALVDAINGAQRDDLKLVIFGSMTDDVLGAIGGKVRSKAIRYIGWVKAEKVYDYLTIADLAIFPGLHSVLWEQAVACGVPCVFRDIEGIHHVDTGGNCVFIEDGSADEIGRAVNAIVGDAKMYEEMKRCALRGRRRFMYSDIARRSIQTSWEEVIV